ncbi:MAG TPA: hypothetical protein VE965_07345 [Gammaproteobacteria bacterium]|nr:hypothetical protein [Gammaproteobacteria bacterium]
MAHYLDLIRDSAVLGGELDNDGDHKITAQGDRKKPGLIAAEG